MQILNINLHHYFNSQYVGDRFYFNSKETEIVLKSFENNNFNNSNFSKIELDSKITNLKKFLIGYKEAKEKDISNKIVAFLKTALFLSLVASEIFVKYSYPDSILLYIIPIITAFLGHHYGKEIKFFESAWFIDIIQDDFFRGIEDLEELFFGLIGGAFFPFYDIMNKQSSIQEEIDSKKNDLMLELNNFKVFLENKSLIIHGREIFLEKLNEIETLLLNPPHEIQNQ